MTPQACLTGPSAGSSSSASGSPATDQGRRDPTPGPATWLRRVGRALALSLALLGALSGAARALTPGNTAGFEIDGNLVCGNVAGSGIALGEDWHSNPPSACVGVIDNTLCTPNPARLPAVFFRDPHWAGSAKDPTAFDGGSNKNDNNIAPGQSPWTVSAGSGPQKNDLTEVFVHSRTDLNGDLWVILAAATRTENGDNHIDFEFNRAGLTLTPGNPGLLTGNGPHNGRSIGDVLISIDYLMGGTDPVPTIRTWNGTQYTSLALPAGAWFASTNSNFSASAPCGATSKTGAIVGSYVPLQIAEVAINLSLVGVTPSQLCSASATLIIKTRTTQEFTGELKDLALIPFAIVTPPSCSILGPAEICGGTTAELCGPAGNLGYAWTGPGGFSASSRCITVSQAGTYNLVVTDLASGCSSVPCSHELRVNPRPVCSIDGVDSTCPAGSNVHNGPPGMASYAWSIAGSGSIVGPTNGPSVTVAASGACNSSYTLTLAVTSGSGCQETCQKTVLVADTTPPILACPPDRQLQCGESTDPSNTGTPTVSDNCPALVLVNFTDQAANAADGSCTGQPDILRTWTATDGCGNVSTCVQRITFVDTTPPVLACPPDRQLSCGESTEPANTGFATATDNCGRTVTIEFRDTPIPAGCAGRPGIERTWTATDGCGNSIRCVQRIEVVDTTPPTMVCPPDIQLPCGTSPVPANTGFPSVIDNCAAAEVLVNFTDQAPNAQEGGCAGQPILRVWTATDPCGNVSTCVQNITFVDDLPPVVTCPTDIVVGACQNVVTFAATATDNCDASPTVACDPPSGTAFPVGQTIVTCSATDDCGNRSQCSFKVTVLPLPGCEITGPAAICAGETAELCGPEGTLGYAWTGPGGFAAATRCITVGAGGTYSLVVTDPATGCTRECPHELSVHQRPACSIAGPTQTCVGVPVELCGPDGSYMYSWTGPGGFAASTRCIFVSAGGDYQLVVTDLATKCASLPCTHRLETLTCAQNCPRTPGFWAAQCDQSPTGRSKFNAAQMTLISECVDDKVGIFNWPAGTDFSRFCATVSTGGTMDQRRQAKRQFAAFLANLCTDELNLIANNGDEIQLDPTTPIACPGLSATTVGALVAAVDARLLALEGQSLADPAVKAEYSNLIACLDAINNGEGIGTVCPSTAADNAFYRGYDPAASGPGDLVELYRPSPNPFGARTRIGFVVTGGERRVEIGIYDLAGRRVRTLVDGHRSPGRYEVVWDGLGDGGTPVVNGVYFVRSAVAGARQVMRVVLVR